MPTAHISAQIVNLNRWSRTTSGANAMPPRGAMI